MTAAVPAEPAQSPDDVLHRLRRGDARAFAELFEGHYEPLTRSIVRLVDSRHVAAELVQDVFLRLWSARAQLDVRRDVAGYLRRAARNRALDWLRREDLHRKWEQAAAHEPHDVVADASAAEERIAQLRLVLAGALEAMPERRRAVCMLRWREGLAPAAIARRLGVSLKTVETHLTRGLKDVRAARRSTPICVDGGEPGYDPRETPVEWTRTSPRPHSLV